MIEEREIARTKIYSILENINDPEIPVISIVDLGIVRDIVEENDSVKIIITPTYSGCPAHDVIKMNIQMAMLENGIKNF
ncbi:iron-sulfur cluster assembly protein, partial [Acinetobacter baumannii]